MHACLQLLYVPCLSACLQPAPPLNSLLRLSTPNHTFILQHTIKAYVINNRLFSFEQDDKEVLDVF